MASAEPSNPTRHHPAAPAEEEYFRQRAMTNKPKTECSCKSYNLYMLGVIGGAVASGSATLTNNFQRYDFDEDKWYPEQNRMKGPQRTRFAVATLKNDIWVLGGIVKVPTSSGGELIQYESEVSLYNRDSGSWSPGTSMTHSRADFCTAVVGERLYAIGGKGTDKSGADKILRTRSGVEVFGEDGKWQPIKKMSYSRSSFASCVAGTRIYVAGGAEARRGYAYAGMVEYYCEKQKLWTSVMFLPDTFPASFGLAFVNGKVCAVGGEGISVISHDMKGPWNPWKDISHTRSQSTFYDAFTLDGELYVIGRTPWNSMISQKCRPPDYTWKELRSPRGPLDTDEVRIALIKIRSCGIAD